MIIMTLAYSQRTDDTSYLSQHYAILKQWTTYLVQEALIPQNQLSTDDFQGTLANQTNLALKGIIAIQAMAVIAETTGNTADATNYENTAKSYISQWQNYAVVTTANPPHTNLDYQDSSSHGRMFFSLIITDTYQNRTPIQPLCRQASRLEPRPAIYLRYAKYILSHRSQ